MISIPADVPEQERTRYGLLVRMTEAARLRMKRGYRLLIIGGLSALMVFPCFGIWLVYSDNLDALPLFIILAIPFNLALFWYLRRYAVAGFRLLAEAEGCRSRFAAHLASRYGKN